MADVNTLAMSVRERWLSQGLRVASVDLDDLVELRTRAPSGIPGEYETFLRVAGLPAEDDQAGFRFWAPRDVRPTRDVLAEAGYATGDGERSVIIADYFQESWWYALWLTGPFAGRVSLVLGDRVGRDPQPPLGTFAEFLLAYLHDDPSLYPPERPS